MESIICDNDTRTILDKMQVLIEKGCIIKGICLVDCTDDQAVILIDNEPINPKMAKVWWSGYKAALQ